MLSYKPMFFVYFQGKYYQSWWNLLVSKLISIIYHTDEIYSVSCNHIMWHTDWDYYILNLLCAGVKGGHTVKKSGEIINYVKHA